jgi:hypothetical protein
VTGAILVAVGKVAVPLAVGTAMVTGAILLTVLRFDPILIAVMPDGRWICLGAWWD